MAESPNIQRSVPLVNTGVRICIGCGSARISIEAGSMACMECGASYERACMPEIRFRQGDTVRIVGGGEEEEDGGGAPANGGDGGGEDEEVYTVRKVSQDGSGAMRYLLASPSSPIMIDYAEGPASYLERVGRKWGQAHGDGAGGGGAGALVLP